MNNPGYAPFGFAQGPEPVEGQVRKNLVETRNQDFQCVAGVYSRILKIRQ
jgi:hypothetical protein